MDDTIQSVRVKNISVEVGSLVIRLNEAGQGFHLYVDGIERKIQAFTLDWDVHRDDLAYMHLTTREYVAIRGQDNG